MRVCLFIAFAIFMSGASLSGQTPDRFRPAMSGWQTGIGFQNGLQLSYHYEVAFLMAKYHFPVLTKKSWSLDIVPQPQLNISRYKVNNNSPNWLHGVEFGVNLGVAFRQAMTNRRVGMYLLGGVGPHYVSGVPERQAKGFIFTDQISLGMMMQINDRIALDVSGGFRHISNASLKRPNGGVNNWVVLGGVVYQVKNEK